MFKKVKILIIILAQNMAPVAPPVPTPMGVKKATRVSRRAFSDETAAIDKSQQGKTVHLICFGTCFRRRCHLRVLEASAGQIYQINAWHVFIIDRKVADL